MHSSLHTPKPTPEYRKQHLYKEPWWIIYWIVLIVSFSTIGFLLVAQATGYRYNVAVGKWQKTGMVIVEVVPKNSTLLFDGEIYPINQSLRLPVVLPGTYRVRIIKDKYQNWEEQITVSSGYVVKVDPIHLFLTTPVEMPITTDIVERVENPITDERVRLADNEIWFNTNLVSRFVTPPSNATLLPTGKHIIYTLGNQLRVIDTNGQHDTLLFHRSSEAITPLAVIDDSTIGFIDNSTVKALKIK